MAKKIKPRIDCRADAYNCLEMARAGLMKPADVIKEINRVKNLNYDKIIINETSADRKTFNTGYVCEALEGSAARVGNVDVTVKSVTHNQSEPDEHGNVSYVSSDIVVNKAGTAGATTFDLVVTPTIYERLDITEAELDDIIAELQQL